MTTASDLGLNDRQLYWATKIVSTVKARGLPVRAAHIAIGTALTESSLLMYANGANPASMAIPHDAVGWDHGSVGLFQQQVGGAPNSTANWGTTAQCMDPNYSTNVFLNALLRFDWANYSNWDAAQKVQGSYDPTGGNYRKNDAQAIRIGNALWGSTAAPAPKPTTPPPPAHHTPPGTRYTVKQGDNLTSIAAKYPDSDITAAYLASINHLANPNAIYPGQVIWIRTPVSSAPHPAPAPHPTATYTVRSGDTLGGIATAHHTTVAQLVAWNRGTYGSLASNPNYIQAGWVLRVG